MQSALALRIAASCVLAAIVAAPRPVITQQLEPVSHEALWLMPRVGAPAPSPDGHWVVFPVIEPAYSQQEQSSDLWVVPGDGTTPPRRLTSTRAAENGIAWSPDSRRIAFTTRREGDEATQIYVLDLVNGGEASRVTTLSTGAEFPKWRPDGQALLFSSLVYPDAADEAANRRIAEERRTRKYNVRAFDSFPVRRWDRWLDDRQVHLFVQSLEPGARAVDLLAGTALVRSPGYGARPLDDGNEQLDAEWAPDGQSIVFVATTARHTAAYASVQRHIYQIAATGGEPRQLTSGNVSHARLRFQPDGRALYFLVNANNDQIYSLDRLAIAPWPWENKHIVLTANFDRSVASFAPAADSQSVYLTAEDAGLEKLYVVPSRGGDTRLAVAPSRGVYTNLSIPRAASSLVVVANWGSTVDPTEIVRIDPGTRQHRPLTQLTASASAKLDWQPVQHFTFTSSRGKSIHNMIVLPSRFDAARRYPLLVLESPSGMGETPRL